MTNLGVDNIVLDPKDLWEDVDNDSNKTEDNTDAKNVDTTDSIPLPTDLKPEDLFDVPSDKTDKKEDVEDDDVTINIVVK